MGAYLSQPKTDKLSTDERNKFLAVGASSMQGWRNNQEDAHNAILLYDDNTSFFAVYDGHGGAEVAAYCADKLPDFLKNLESYKNADFEKALKEAFLGFDKTLLEPEVVNILKVLAGEARDEEAEETEDDPDEDLAELHEESSLSLKEVLKRYGDKLDQQFKVLVKNKEGGKEHEDNDDDDDDVDDAALDDALAAPYIKRMKDSSKPQSPFLRGRRAAAVIAESVNKKVLDPESQPAGSSTSAAAASSAGSSSSQAAGGSAKNETDEDATVSSTNMVSNKLQKNIPNNHAEKLEKEAEAEPKSAEVTNGEEVVPDSSRIVKENEQNGSVTSSESKAAATKPQVSTSEAKKKDQQNGAAERISTSSISAASTSKSVKTKPTENSILMDDYSTDDDADYDETTNSEDDDDDDDDDEDGDAGDDEADDDDDDDDEMDDDEVMPVDDAETIEANEQFCANMAEEPGQDSGCTAVVALLHGRDLYVANAGDSRCVVSRNGKAIEMSFDHKPEDPEENSRILKAGGRVSVDGRVNGGLNLSRAIGDHAYKLNESLPAEEQMISALPDVRKLIITPEDEFMVLACDGIWNYMSSSEVVEFVRKRLDEKDPEQSMSKICEQLFDNCLAPNTMGDGTGCDNMTAVIVRFQPEIKELNSKLNENEVEIKVEETKLDTTQNSETNTMKRIASSSLDDQKQQNKRLKTDNEEENSSSATSSQISSSTTASKQSIKCAQTETAASSSTVAASSTISTSEACTSDIAANTNECDSGLPDSSEVTAGSS